MAKQDGMAGDNQMTQRRKKVIKTNPTKSNTEFSPRKFTPEQKTWRIIALLAVGFVVFVTYMVLSVERYETPQRLPIQKSLIVDTKKSLAVGGTYRINRKYAANDKLVVCFARQSLAEYNKAGEKWLKLRGDVKAYKTRDEMYAVELARNAMDDLVFDTRKLRILEVLQLKNKTGCMRINANKSVTILKGTDRAGFVFGNFHSWKPFPMWANGFWIGERAEKGLIVGAMYRILRRASKDGKFPVCTSREAAIEYAKAMQAENKTRLQDITIRTKGLSTTKAMALKNLFGCLLVSTSTSVTILKAMGKDGYIYGNFHGWGLFPVWSHSNYIGERIK